MLQNITIKSFMILVSHFLNTNISHNIKSILLKNTVIVIIFWVLVQ